MCGDVGRVCLDDVCYFVMICVVCVVVCCLLMLWCDVDDV